MFRGNLQDEIQSEMIYRDSRGKREHLLHDIEPFHDPDEFNANVRADNRNVMSSQEYSGSSFVDIIHQSRDCMGWIPLLAIRLPVRS